MDRRGILPRAPERSDGAVVLIAVEREEIFRGVFFDDSREAMQPLAVALDVAAQLDFEMV